MAREREDANQIDRAVGERSRLPSSSDHHQGQSNAAPQYLEGQRQGTVVVMERHCGQGAQNCSHYYQHPSLGHAWVESRQVVVENEASSHLDSKVEMGKKRKVCEMFFSLRDLGAKVVVPHPGKAWKPSRSQKPNCHLLPPRATLHFTQQYWEVEELVLDHIEELWLVNKSIHCLLIWSKILESAKDSVPDRKESTIVLVQAVSI